MCAPTSLRPWRVQLAPCASATISRKAATHAPPVGRPVKKGSCADGQAGSGLRSMIGGVVECRIRGVTSWALRTLGARKLSGSTGAAPERSFSTHERNPPT